MQPLFDAAKNNDLDAIEKLSQLSGFDPNCRDHSGRTPLMWASYYGHLDAMKLLIAKGTHLTLKDNNGSTIIHYAGQSRSIGILEFCEQNGLDLKAINDLGKSLLHYATCMDSNQPVITFLLNKGLDINLQDNEGTTPVYGVLDSSKKMNPSDISFLMQKGADITQKDWLGNNLMHFAAKSGNTEIMEFLEQQGFDYRSPNHLGEVPFHYAARNSKNTESVFTFLIKKGADINARNNDGRTPLHDAISQQSNVDIISSLVQCGANVDIRDNDEGWSPLHLAVYTKRLEAAKKLIENKATVDLRSKKNFAPIHYARFHNFQELKELLKNSGSQIDAETHYARRQASNVLNNTVLSYHLQNQYKIDFSDGGNEIEARNTLRSMLSEYIEQNKDDLDDRSKALLSALDSVASDPERVFQAPLIKTMFSYTGCKKHIFYFSVEKKNPDYEFRFAERGLFAKKSDKKGKVKAFFSLQVPEKCFGKVINKLSMAKCKSKEVAEKILFEEIPAITGTQYVYSDADKAPFKQGHCYFENMKSIIQDEWKKKLGDDKGEFHYKNFGLFMEKKELDQLMSDQSDFDAKASMNSFLEDRLQDKEVNVRVLCKKAYGSKLA